MRDALADFARARSGYSDLAVATTTAALDLKALEEALGCWYMVNHAGLEAGKSKTVFAACDREHLADVLGKLG